VLHLLRSVSGLDQVVFGTDYPYPHDCISIGGLRTLRRTAELTDAERASVLGDTVSRLIGRMARQAA
jgi:predicted TIM-barrel fold metal-dependent hydrolase